MKKCFQFLAVLLSVATIFSSCQKELSQEGGIALGNMVKDSNGNCNGFLVQGSYQKDTLLTANNYVDVALNITQAGTYLISSNTVNGYSFRGTGFTSLIGVNTFRMQATGKPIAVGTDVFTVKFSGGDSCQVNITVTAGSGGGGGTGNAIFTFPNGTSCAGATQTNNFYAGIPTVAAVNTITLLVNVSTPGAYNLSTTLANGLTFTGTGNFANVGNNQPLILRASGTPTTAGNTSYTFSPTSPTASSCGFDLIVQPTPGPATYTINCGVAATQTGTFQAGTALTTSDKITINVTPATTGTYSITTNTVNGVSFVGAGNFATAVTQNVDLYASTTNNTPTAAGTFTYTTNGGTAACTNVSVIYTAASGGGGGTGFIKCSIDGGPISTFDSNPLVVSVLTGISYQISADNASGDSFDASVLSPTFGIGTTYTINQILSGVAVDANYTLSTGTIYSAQTGATPVLVSPFTITFTSITATRAVGTFSGVLKDNGGVGPGSKMITNGTFDLPF